MSINPVFNNENPFKIVRTIEHRSYDEEGRLTVKKTIDKIDNVSIVSTNRYPAYPEVGEIIYFNGKLQVWNDEFWETIADSATSGLDPATTTTLGVIKVGSGLTITIDGTLSVEVDADHVVLDSVNFGTGVLSTSDDTVQKAMDRIDDHESFDSDIKSIKAKLV